MRAEREAGSRDQVTAAVKISLSIIHYSVPSLIVISEQASVLRKRRKQRWIDRAQSAPLCTMQVA